MTSNLDDECVLKGTSRSSPLRLYYTTFQGRSQNEILEGLRRNLWGQQKLLGGKMTYLGANAWNLVKNDVQLKLFYGAKQNLGGGQLPPLLSPGYVSAIFS